VETWAGPDSYRFTAGSRLRLALPALASASRVVVVVRRKVAEDNMFPVHVDRISLQKDQKWESSFISWIEDLEERKVGVEDGFFVVSNCVT